jgi:two-component system, sensor histidine kinase and response regulator
MKQRTSPSSDAAERGGVNVLLVEDNRVNRIVATKMLGRLGCEVTIAENGKIALDILDCKIFDLVFMDVQMPEMDGLTAVGRIRLDGRFEALPVIAMTAHAMASDRQRCLGAGMDDYFTKPVKVEQIQAMIEKWKAGRVGSPSGSVPNDAVVGAPQSQQAASEVAPPRPCPLALERALSNLGGDAELLEEVVQVFLQTIPELLSQLNNAVRSGDAKEIAAAAHSIKGAAANIGAEVVSETARKLELMGKAETIADAAKEIESLTGELDALVSFARDKFASCADIAI